jgi:hypothetical protein
MITIELDNEHALLVEKAISLLLKEIDNMPVTNHVAQKNRQLLQDVRNVIWDPLRADKIPPMFTYQIFGEFPSAKV